MARVDIAWTAMGQDRNQVKVAVEPDNPDYANCNGLPPKGNDPGGGPPASAQFGHPRYAG